MARKKHKTVSRSVACSACGISTHIFVCVRFPQPDGTLPDPVPLCLSCREAEYIKHKQRVASELARAEKAVRHTDWEW